MVQQKTMCSQCGKRPAVAAILEKATDIEKELILKSRGPETSERILFSGEWYIVGKYCQSDLEGFLVSGKEKVEQGLWKTVGLEEFSRILEVEKARRNGKERNF